MQMFILGSPKNSHPLFGVDSYSQLHPFDATAYPSLRETWEPQPNYSRPKVRYTLDKSPAHRAGDKLAHMEQRQTWNQFGSQSAKRETQTPQCPTQRLKHTTLFPATSNILRQVHSWRQMLL